MWVIKKRWPFIPMSSLPLCYLSVHAAGISTIEWLPDFIGPVPPSLLIISLLNFFFVIIAWANHTCKVGKIKFKNTLKNIFRKYKWYAHSGSGSVNGRGKRNRKGRSGFQWYKANKKCNNARLLHFLLVVRFCCLLVGIDWSLFTKAVEVDRGCLKYYKAFGKVKNQIWLCCSPGAFFLRLMVTSWGVLSSS